MRTTGDGLSGDSASAVKTWVDAQIKISPLTPTNEVGIPHTFLVSSETARFLLVTEPGNFSGFLRTLAEPADDVVIPPPATEPPDVAAMSQVAADYGIEILGPPGIPA